MSGAQRLIALACLLGWCVAPSAYGQTSGGVLADYAVASWTDRDGLPALRIVAIAQDADGYLWLGTVAGAVRFDGLRFVPLTTIVRPPLPVDSVLALIAGRDRSMWVGFDAAGIARVKDGHLRLYTEQDGLGSGYVYALLEDHVGTIWAGTRQGLYTLRGDRWQHVGDGLPEGPILTAFEDGRHQLWVATRNTVLRRATGDGSFQEVGLVESSGFLSPRFSEDSSGTVWMTDRRRGFRQVGESRKASRQSAFAGSGVYLLHDRRGTLWVATQGQGLWRARSTHEERPRIDTLTVNHGLLSDAVRSLFEDREGNIWVGTYEGLQRLSPRRVAALTDFGIARGVAVTADGTVWIATASGLMRLSTTGRQVFGERDGLPGSTVLALHVDAAGVLWVGTDRGVARLVHDRFVHLPIPPDRELNRPVAITSVGQTIWIRDLDRGMLRWADGVLAPFQIPKPFPATIFTAYPDSHGRLWLGSIGRVGVMGPEGQFHGYDLNIGNVFAIAEDHTGSLWAGGSDGLSRLTGERWVTISRQNGLPTTVYSLVEDADGALWAGLDAGIARIEPREFDKAATTPGYQLRYTLLDSSDGSAGTPTQLGGTANLARAPDGRLWFVTVGGLTIVDPRSLGAPRPPPPVRIESVTANTERLAPEANVRLPANTSHLRIEFTSLTLTNPGRVLFRYRLEGFDRDWIQAGGIRQAVYTNLPPARYKFRVAASNNDGNWSEAGATWDFTILPAFYQTRTFYAACALAAAALAWAAWRFRVAQVRRQFALVLAERIRLSRAIHDTLLQGLVGLALQFNDLSRTVESSPPAKEALARIRRQVEEYIREARNSIWDLRSPRLETRDLPTALREGAARAIAGRSVAFDLAVSGTPKECSSQSEEQLVLIGQEAVRNAIQHGQARRIRMELRYEADRLGLRVVDDGCGFDVEAVHRAAGQHYGLINMRESAEQVRGSCHVASRLGQGTEVDAVVPLG